MLFCEKNFAQNLFPSSGSTGIGTSSPAISAILEIKSNSKGMLTPRMKQSERDAIVSPATGLLIFQTNNRPGFYYYDGSKWSPISSKGASLSLSNLNSTTAVNADLIPDSNNNKNLGSSSLRWKNVNFYNLNFSDGSVQTTASPWQTSGGNTFLNSGNIGLGTSNPTAKLEVNGHIKITDGTQGLGKVLTSDVDGLTSWVLPLWTLSGNNIYTLTGNTGIGTNTPGYKLDILHNGSTGIRVKSSYFYSTVDIDGNNGDAAIRFIANSTNQWNVRNRPEDNYFEIFEMQDANSSRFVIQDKTGYVGIGANPTAKLSVNGSANKPGGGSWTVFSDARLKQDVQEFTDGLDQVMKIKPVKYHYNEISGFDVKPEYVGVLAQDLQKVAPYMVSEVTMSTGSKTVSKTDKNSSTGMSLDNTNNSSKTQYLQVDNSAMTYMLINAVKEMKGMMDEKNVQINNMQKQIDDLKAIITVKQTNNSVTNQQVNISAKGASDVASLQQNFPNPFNGTTTIKYYLPANMNNANINFYAANGALLKTLKLTTKGNGSINLNAKELPSASYRYALIVDGKTIDSKQMMITR